MRSLYHLPPLQHPSQLTTSYQNFDGQIRSMQGEQFQISLVDDVKPFCVNTPRSIPFVYCDKLKTELDILERQQIITPVTTHTEWCAPIVVTPKNNADQIRMCVDLSHLNHTCIKKGTNHLPQHK